MSKDERFFDLYYNIADIYNILKENIKDEELVERVYKIIRNHSFKNNTNKSINEISLEAIEFILASLHFNEKKIHDILEAIDPERDLVEESLYEETKYDI